MASKFVLSIKGRLIALLAAMVVVALALALALVALWQGAEGLSNQLTRAQRSAMALQASAEHLNDALAHLAMAQLHDPRGPAATFHASHPVQQHLDALDADLAQIDRDLIQAGKQFDVWAVKSMRVRWGAAFATPMRAALAEGRYPDAEALFSERGRDLTAAWAVVVDAESGLIARQLSEWVDATYAQWRAFMMVLFALCALVLAGAFVLVAATLRAILGPLRVARGVFDRLAEGRFDNDIVSSRRDELGDLLDGLRSMQTRVGLDVSQARATANELLRVKHALDAASGGMMIADVDGRVVYVNPAAQNMLRRADPDIRKALPSFDAGQVLGQHLDAFHERPPHQQHLLAGGHGAHTTVIDLGGHKFRLVVTPVVDAQGERLGSCTEWTDITAELKGRAALAELVAGAAADFSARLASEGKTGFMLQMAQGLNALLGTLEDGMNDLACVLAAMAQGDLGQPIDRDYVGTLKEDLHRTGDALRKIATDIREGAGTSAQAPSETSQGPQVLPARTDQPR